LLVGQFLQDLRRAVGRHGGIHLGELLQVGGFLWAFSTFLFEEAIGPFILFILHAMSLLEPPQSILRLLRESLPDTPTSINEVDVDDGHEEILSYVAFLAAGLAEANQFDAAVWKDVLQPYLEEVGQIDSSAVNKFCQAVERELTEQDDAESYGEEDEDVEELCDLRFNLAYGGKILLHQTKLHLLRGRRYALVGPNGVGKTTLMNAISNEKIDGWPSHLVTSYVDSGSNVDPTYEAQIVLPYLTESTKRSKEDCIAKLQELDFTDAMLESPIGALSGGWQMKLRLVRAVLINPDIYLLDEVRSLQCCGSPALMSHCESLVLTIALYFLLHKTSQRITCRNLLSSGLQTTC